MLYYVLGSPPPLWGQGMGGAREASWGQGGARGASWDQAGSETSEMNVILGFRVPITCGKKTLMTTYSG